MILQKLKDATVNFHRLAEEINFSNDILSSSINRDNYLLLLKRMHGFISQLTLLQSVHNLENSIPTLFFRHKSSLIYDDISQLQNNFISLKGPFNEMDYHEYLGFCYVGMGSMLGGQYIYKKLTETSLVLAGFPLTYFASCTESVLADWKCFIKYLQAVSNIHDSSIIKGAITAYLYFIYLCTTIKN